MSMASLACSNFVKCTSFKKFWAIGSSKAYALGAMYAVYDALKQPEDITRVGIHASCEFDSSCDLPMSLYTINLVKHPGEPNAGKP